MEKAKGAYIRSRAKWIEERERNSAYFSRLDKSRQEKNNIRSLIIDGSESSNANDIAQKNFLFYSNLYKSTFSKINADAFFDSIKPFIPQISLEFKEICDAKISLQELENALQALSSDKSPGSDGLTANLKKKIWHSIKCILFKALTEITECLSLSHTMKQGVIILIPKPGKDPKILDNLRPITLLNNDYKLLAHIYSNRLKSGLSQIISNTQSGFMRGRSIHNNLRLVQDLIDYN